MLIDMDITSFVLTEDIAVRTRLSVLAFLITLLFTRYIVLSICIYIFTNGDLFVLFDAANDTNWSNMITHKYCLLQVMA